VPLPPLLEIGARLLVDELDVGLLLRDELLRDELLFNAPMLVSVAADVAGKLLADELPDIPLLAGMFPLIPVSLLILASGVVIGVVATLLTVEAPDSSEDKRSSVLV
jgi:hypothetical protein